jgi:hypothetical protein
MRVIEITEITETLVDYAMGQDEDIKHESLEGIVGEVYGIVVCIMKKKLIVIVNKSKSDWLHFTRFLPTSVELQFLS